MCVNGFVSEVTTIQHGVPQGSLVLFFFFYIFADDTNLLNISKDYKTLQNNVDRDLRSLNEWLLANKISLNKDKTELIYFHKARSKVPTNLKIKMNGKKLYHSTKTKYLGIYVDETLSGNEHSEDLSKKLNRANGILAKARHYAPHFSSEKYLSCYLCIQSSLWFSSMGTSI